MDWYLEAEKQTIATLPTFIAKVRETFITYTDISNAKDNKQLTREESEKGYRNGMIVGILLSYASFNATANTYGFSCNQAGVVRNVLYGLVRDREYMPFERL
jgi:hypothetical protein